MVEVTTIKRRVLAVAIHGKCDEKSLRKLADKTLDDLTNLPGITQVEIAGIRKPQIGIEVSESSLREHGLSFDEVARNLTQNINRCPWWRCPYRRRRDFAAGNGQGKGWSGVQCDRITVLQKMGRA